LSAAASFLRDYPDHPGSETVENYLRDLKRTLGGMYYNRAVFYDKSRRKPQAALISYEDYLRNFPGGEHVREARKRAMVLAKQVEEAEQEAYEAALRLDTEGKPRDAIAAYGRFISKFPGSSRVALAHDRIRRLDDQLREQSDGKD
jgi:outer membrane protein assembly factor BamD (BamD/ComL family)